MRFFVAKGAAQNDGGFFGGWKLWRRFALDRFVCGRLGQKRRQSRRSPKVLVARFVRDSSLLNRREFFLHVCGGAHLKIWLDGFGDLQGFLVVCAGFVFAALGGECVA
jgi:hypothetical protein